MVSCFACFDSRSSRNDRSENQDSPDQDEEMHTAVERNSYTSFVTCDDKFDSMVVLNDAMLPDILQKGFENMALLREMMVSKQGFIPNGTVEDTNLWYIGRSATGLPPIALGEIRISGLPSLTPTMVGEYILDLENKPKWDTELQLAEVIVRSPVNCLDDPSTVTAGYFKTWAGMKPKPGISGRDFVYNGISRSHESEFCAVSWSVEDIDCPIQYRPGVRSPNHTRGKIILAGFLVRKNENNEVLINYLTQVETGISGWMVDPVVKKSPKLLNGLKKYINERTM